MSSKKDKLSGASSKLKQRAKGSLVDKKEMAKTLKSPTSKYKKVLLVVEREQNIELDELVKQVNQLTKRDVNKSLLVRMGIDLIKEKQPKEILSIINGI